MKHLATIQNEFIKFARLLDDINEIDNSDKLSVFLGGNCTDNVWRQDIKKLYPEILFLDPYDDNWEADENIYDECTGLAKADFVVFYKGGKLTEKEQNYLRLINKDYNEFDDLETLKKYLDQLHKDRK